ncbi:MAG: translation initiation factor IF-3 [Patescibacteria group bacterium]|nr:translation initiation factor IF-3 [Patescibacteria group bacterium]
MFKRIFINEQIRADKVRLIGEDGKQLGIFNLPEALQKAREKGLDLIKVTEKIQPPVCKIMDYGKYLYRLQKRERKSQKKAGELKNIRLGFNIAEHDLETRARAAEKFLKKGDKVRLELILRGREKGLADFGKEKIKRFLEILRKTVPLKIERPLKREARGLTMIITKV